MGQRACCAELCGAELTEASPRRHATCQGHSWHDRPCSLPKELIDVYEHASIQDYVVDAPSPPVLNEIFHALPY